MKTCHSGCKKNELRERFLRYAIEHAQEGRIPTVAEFRRALGVTNYMLLNCMKELEKEGVIYKKSRKEGTFLSNGGSKSVVGLIIEQGRENEYVNNPSWLSGFCGEFSHQCDYLLRMIQIPSDGDIPALIRRLGLDALVILSNGPFRKKGKPCDSKIVYALTGMAENCGIELPEYNTVSVDSEHWIREYVKAGVKSGKRNFAIIAPEDALSSVMIGEIKQQGLPWNEECHLTDCKTLKKKLPEIVSKYKIDAVRCTGKYQPDFSAAAEKIQNFHPFFPYFGTESVYRKQQENKSAPACSFIFEHLDDFYTRQGKITAQKVFEMIRSGKEFSSIKIKLAFSQQYQHLSINPNGDEK